MLVVVDGHLKPPQKSPKILAKCRLTPGPTDRRSGHGPWSRAIDGKQRQNRLYALQDRQDQEDSPDMVTGTLRVFNLDVYALIDPGATISFITLYIAVNFNVSPETLSKPFSVSTPVQVLSSQITHRSNPDLQFNNISGESSFFKNN
uniref:Gag-pol polyprotein n=1 Tax=Solanum tuberosum TaxID=4113 RepID=M1DFF0_SOLTU